MERSLSLSVEPIRNEPEPELPWLREALEGDLAFEIPPADDLTGAPPPRPAADRPAGQFYDGIRQQAGVVFHPLVLRSGYNGILLGRADKPLWGRFLFEQAASPSSPTKRTYVWAGPAGRSPKSADREEPEFRVRVKCRVSWGGPGAARACEELEGWFDLIQGIVTLGLQQREDPTGLLEASSPGYRLVLKPDGSGFTGISAQRQVLVADASDPVECAGRGPLVQCALTNLTFNVDLIPGNKQPGVANGLVVAPWELSVAAPAGLHHVPGSLSFSVLGEGQALVGGEADSLAMLPQDHELVLMMRDQDPTSLLWELTPNGRLVSLKSGHQLHYDGESLKMVACDDTDPEQQSDDGKQWGLYVAVTAVEALVGAAAMRYVGFLVKHVQGVEVSPALAALSRGQVVIRAVIYIEAYPYDPEGVTASLNGVVEWTVHRVTQFEEGTDSAAVAAKFSLHAEQGHPASHRFTGGFKYGQAVAQLNLDDCVDEYAMLFAASACCANTRVCQIAFSHDATECAMFMDSGVDFESDVVEVVRAHAMHDRSPKLTPGTSVDDFLVGSIVPAEATGAAVLSGAGSLTWRHHVHGACTEIQLCVASTGSQMVSVHLGGPDGPLIAQREIGPTGALDEFKVEVRVRFAWLVDRFGRCWRCCRIRRQKTSM